jgi:hypothetical protein
MDNSPFEVVATARQLFRRMPAQLPKSTGSVASRSMWRVAPPNTSSRSRVWPVGAHDQQIRTLRAALCEQDLACVPVRLAHSVRANGEAMPPQHRGRSFKARGGLVADRA